MGTAKAAAVLLAVMIILGGCATIEQLVKKPAITFDNLAVREMSLTQGTFLFRFNVANPNPVGLHLDDIVYDLELNGQRVVSSRLDRGVRLVASGSSPLEIPITIDYLDFFDSLSALVGADRLDYRLSGSAAVGPLRVPYRSSGQLDLPQLPAISVERIKIDNLSLSGADAILRIGLANPNAFGLTMGGLEYAARLGDLELAKGTARVVNALKARGRATMDLDIHLDFLKMGRGATMLLSEPSSRCRLIGNMLMDTPAGMHKVPFRFDGTVPLSK